MLKIESNEKQLNVAASGSLPEIASDLVRIMQEIRNGMHNNSPNGMLFDFFLKDVFIDLVFADDIGETVDALMNSLRRVYDKDEAEHK
jgi:hypothetical protein